MDNSNSRSWRCVVCGYIHYGDEAPEICPICGAGKDDFERYLEPAPLSRQDDSYWHCIICRHSHSGPTPPEVCPVCGAAADKFEPAPKSGVSSGKGKTIAIVGAGIAGLAAAESARRASPDVRIVLFSQERHLPYYRLNLTRYLAGEIGDEELPIYPEHWYGERAIELRRGAEVVSLDLRENVLGFGEGEVLHFDSLVLATGAHSWMPPIRGADQPGVVAVRTCDDARGILQKLRQGMKCVCIGGGILGIETAGALKRHGMEVTLLESFPWLMPRQLDRRAGGILDAYLGKIGIRLRTGVKIREISENASGVSLEDGSVVPADFVLVTAGIRANTHLARRAGLKVNQGIAVDKYLETSHPNVFAAGDAAEYQGQIYGLWGPAQYQGTIAGLNAAGDRVEFGGIPRSNTLKVLGINLFSIGKFEPDDGSYVAIAGESGDNFHHFLFHDHRLVGAILIGDTSISHQVKKAIETGIDFAPLFRQKPGVLDVAQWVGNLR